MAHLRNTLDGALVGKLDYSAISALPKGRDGWKSKEEEFVRFYVDR